MAIPFSEFINISTTGVSDSFTFNRLNALVMTTPSVPMPVTLEVTSASDVATAYGTSSEQYSYATEFFGYSSKNATSPQKMTFYNYHEEAQAPALVGATLSTLADIKQSGDITFTINATEYTYTLDLSSITSFSEGASLINALLNTEGTPASPYYLIFASESVSLPLQENITLSSGELVIKNASDETIFTYGEITLETTDYLTDIINKLNTSELAEANLVWSEDNGSLKLSQVVYSSNTGEIPRSVTCTNETLAGLFSSATAYDGTPAVYSSSLGTVEYSTLTGGYIIKGATATSEATISFATGAMAEVLLLTETSGGYVTAGTDGEDLSTALNNIDNLRGDWVSIACLNDIATSDFETIASWTNSSSGRYLFIAIDNDARLKSTSTQVYSNLSDYDGFFLIYSPNMNKNLLAYVQGAIASVDFSVANGFTNFNFMPCSQFEDEAITETSELNGINNNLANAVYFTRDYGQDAYYFGEGKIFGGNFSNIANYIGNSWIKAKMEIAGMNMFEANNNISLRGGKGKGIVLAYMQDVINTALLSGIIEPVGTGELSTTEKSTIVSNTGTESAVTLIEQNGYYITVLDVNSEDIANNRMRLQLFYTRNIPTNRLQVQVFVL